MGDDLYVNDGETYTNGVYYPEEPVEQVEETAKAKGVLAASYPILDDVADWFRDAIAELGDIDSIDSQQTTINGVTVSTKVSIEAQYYGNQIARQLLRDKFKEFSEWGKDRS